jgi:hypothetical protein
VAINPHNISVSLWKTLQDSGARSRPPGGADGENPSSGVIMDASGNLYGTTTNGGDE